MFEAHNRVAIVTGAGSGIGRRIALQLAQAQANVVVNDLDPDLTEALCSELQTLGGHAVAVNGDSSEVPVIDRMIDAATDRFGRLDYAIANAGITTFGSFLDYPVEDFQRLVDVNLRGSFYLAQRAARHLIAQHDSAPDGSTGGRLVLMSSVTGLQYHPDLAAYGMSKAAIRMLAKSLGVELARYGITANAVAPGATSTERTLAEPDYESTWARLTPTGRASDTGDIADAVMFLLSPSASQITGQTLVVDGGWTSLSPPPP